MQELLEEFQTILDDKELKIFLMRFVGFEFSEICKEYDISRMELTKKWRKIKEKLLSRFVKKL